MFNIINQQRTHFVKTDKLDLIHHSIHILSARFFLNKEQTLLSSSLHLIAVFFESFQEIILFMCHTEHIKWLPRVFICIFGSITRRTLVRYTGITGC